MGANQSRSRSADYIFVSFVSLCVIQLHYYNVLLIADYFQVIIACFVLIPFVNIILECTKLILLSKSQRNLQIVGR